jgi:hypothetical protein
MRGVIVTEEPCEVTLVSAKAVTQELQTDMKIGKAYENCKGI